MSQTLLTPEEQARLRATGLLAGPHERWEHPCGGFHLQALPRVFQPERRQRSDRMTRFEEMNRKSTTTSTTPYRKAVRR